MSYVALVRQTEGKELTKEEKQRLRKEKKQQKKNKEKKDDKESEKEKDTSNTPMTVSQPPAPVTAQKGAYLIPSFDVIPQ